ncbi:Peroxisome chaperone and import receptor [Malassezia yamatoensis]|uniref:Peroxisome chaperone and import receptor n=1 Tax=Malassezia yamatoensis TaxID=253288 RepID=A0AAJ5YUS8_9BASI|nr:Peroxisome chaperone and import receptor [Malassezia yamatoensis]
MSLPKSAAEDLDDLDDVLDDFQHTPPKPVPSESSTEKAKDLSQAEQKLDDDEDPLSEDFVQELTKNMENFMRQMGQGETTRPPIPGGDAASGTKEQALAEDEMMKQFERMLSGAKQEPTTKAEPSTATPSSNDSFQNVVQATMDKLKQSNKDASASNSASADPSNLFANLGLDENTDLAQMLEALGGAGEGNGDMSELSKMLGSMMDDLMGKNVLYEPLKDMHSRFPAYFESKEGKALNEEDRKRYRKQEAIMSDIIAVFEEKSYNDTDPACKKRISDLVAQMQELGSPPQALLGDMPQELSGLNGMLSGDADENCTVM